jgi:KaiC/GvpD/RAD55 family RecA-like ATPase
MNAQENSAERLIRASVAVLLSPDQIVELRALGVKQWNGWESTASGYFNSPESLVRAAIETEEQDAKAVYITLNAVDPRLLSRRNNRVKAIRNKDPTTSDGDIIRRRWLLVDLDPIRPSGISSTEPEHVKAEARAGSIKAYLRDEGWPEPVKADSGNGTHLLYRIDLPNDQESAALIERILAALAARFNDEAVAVDQTVFNAARIVKLPGTMARKGDSTPERPHRRSHLLEVPKHLEVVTKEQLERVAAFAPEESGPAPLANGRSVDVETYLAAHGLEVSKDGSWNDGQRWELQNCPWEASHKGSAYVVQFESGAIAAGCHHNSCREKKWHDLRDTVEGPGWRRGNGRSASFDFSGDRVEHRQEHRGGGHVSDDAPGSRNGTKRGATEATDPSGLDALAPLSVGAVLAKEEERLERGPVLIPTGWTRLDAALDGGLAVPSLNVLGAAPKSSKSTLVQMTAVRHVEAGGVAYILDLENGRRRILRQILCRRAELGPKEVARALKNERDGVFASREEAERWRAAKEWVRKALAPGLFIEAVPPSDFAARVEAVREAAGDRKVLVVVDSLQKLPGGPREERRTTIDKWIRLFEQLRLRHEAVFLVISEIRRGKDGYAAREDAFKESGGIEYAADLAMTLNRPAADEDTDTPSTLRVELARDSEQDPRGEIASYRPVRPWYGLEEIEPVPIKRSKAHGPPAEKTDGAREFLSNLLKEGPVPAADALSRGKAAGFSERTLYRAKGALGIQTCSIGSEKAWRLPCP